MAAQPVERSIQPERGLIGTVAEEGEPARITHHDVELVAMKNDVVFAVGRFVLFSSKNSVGGGPYLVEETYPLAPPLAA